MNTSSKKDKSELPRNVKVVLCFIACILLLSAACLIYSIVFFNNYADAFITRHPTSFQDIADISLSHKIVLGALIFRVLVALSWIASFLYLKNYLIKNEKYRVPTMIGYGVISLMGFTYLALHAELHTIFIIRAIQVFLTIAMLFFLIFDVATSKKLHRN